MAFKPQTVNRIRLCGNSISGTKTLNRPEDEEAGEFRTSFGLDREHYFTPQEASKLLSDIKPKVKKLIERKKVVTSLHTELERYSLLGIKTAEFTEKAEQLDTLVEEMTKMIAELEDLGIQVKDLDSGLVDFPAERYGEKVLLCWRYGESEVSYWHKPNEGFVGRKLLKAEAISP